MIFPDWQRHKARTEPRCQARCAVSTRKGEVYGWSLREFGKGLRSHFLPYLNDTADYTFKLSLIMSICSVNYNAKARVMFWKGGGQSRSLHTGWNWTEIFFLFFFLTNTGKLASPTDYSTLVPIPLNIRTPLSLVEKRTHWATCPLNRSPHSVVRSEGGKCGTIYFLFAGTGAYQVNERSPGPRVPHALPSGTTSTY